MEGEGRPVARNYDKLESLLEQAKILAEQLRYTDPAGVVYEESFRALITHLNAAHSHVNSIRQPKLAVFKSCPKCGGSKKMITYNAGFMFRQYKRCLCDNSEAIEQICYSSKKRTDVKNRMDSESVEPGDGLY